MSHWQLVTCCYWHHWGGCLRYWQWWRWHYCLLHYQQLHTVTNGMFYDQIQQLADTVCDPTVVRWLVYVYMYHMTRHCIIWSTTVSCDPQCSTMKLVDDNLLLRCCPYLGSFTIVVCWHRVHGVYYLGEFNRVLSEFAAGRTLRPHKG